MKNTSLIQIKRTFVLGMVLVLALGCERDLTDDAIPATFAKVGDIFTDDFVSMGSDFYFPFGGSKLDAFSVDTEVGYESSASYRIDVPNSDDPAGNYAGAILRVDGSGRDLSGYDALTFWAKASRGVSIDAVGFGQDFLDNKFQVNASNLSVGTNWSKFTIPIPDASKLTEERGLFWYAAGTQATGGSGYVIWLDEIKFENLGNIAHPRPAILNGSNVIEETFSGATIALTGLTQTLNLASGVNQEVTISPNYFAFTSSNTSVATVSELGIVDIVGGGEAVITATLDGIDAEGSLNITSLGDFNPAPVPTVEASSVISIFSDAYTNEPVDYYNGYWAPFQTTQGQNDIQINGDNIIKYSELNFVGIQFAVDVPTIDVSQMTHFHIDIQVQGDIDPGDFLQVKLQDIGADNAFGGTDDSDDELTLTNTTLVSNSWVSIDVPISDFPGLTSRSNLAQVVFISDATITDVYVDNIYFYEISAEPTDAAPTPTVPAANVISIFSDAYANVAGTNLNPDWGQGTAVTEEAIEGNNALKYSGLDYQGILLGSAQDVSGMTHLHIDYFTANSTALNAFLISSGPIEKAKALTVPSATGWTSLEIPLADFNPVDLADIIQLKFDGNGDIYIDNIYFHN
ncbi:Beta-galactosidase [Winogradskyella psychrotolerans RS-3]|uniref:Beta-galactosidase n=1 Tax=Winogradskyella psychrotolerans RS-3 TaxID=641526 RepID=S7VPG1_9FLAO|nr:beta-galactosidase [Winogradskyella psychrotolerans]EPR71212.1 Beta-galactosidase [Winogradskyella psychrotolerans RS-3]